MGQWCLVISMEWIDVSLWKDTSADEWSNGSQTCNSYGIVDTSTCLWHIDHYPPPDTFLEDFLEIFK